MKRLFFALILVAGSLAAVSTQAQPFIRARVGFGFPHPRVYCPPVPRVAYYPPAPYYGGVVIGPAYGYRHYAPYYREHRYYRGRRW